MGRPSSPRPSRARRRNGRRSSRRRESGRASEPGGWRAGLLKIDNPPSDLASTLDKALDGRAQSSIFQSDERERPWPKRQLDRQDFERVETHPRTGIGRKERTGLEEMSIEMRV